MQAAALPRALAGESFRAVAPTGTGKTLIYLLAAWSLRAPRSRATALVLVPTRELAYQVSQMLQQLDPALREGTALAVGGHARRSQDRALAGWRLLIATPGRLLDLLGDGTVSLRSLSLLVLDEFDKLIGLGFEEQIAEILRAAPAAAQRLLFSATDQESGPAGALGLGALPLVAVEREPGTRTLEEQFYFLRSARKKGALLEEELARAASGQAIVFVGNRDKANHLHGLLKLRGHSSVQLHGHMSQRDRARAYQDFKEGRFRVLVATDLAARGLDLPETDLIVNYDLPRHYKDYVHRTGRAARRGRPGRCVSYAGPEEYLPMRNLEKEFPGPLPLHPGYSQRDPWFVNAKRLHDAKVKSEERKDFIRREQGL